MNAYDAVYLRLLNYSKHTWGDDAAAPFIAACMLSTLEIVFALAIVAVANLLDLNWQITHTTSKFLLGTVLASLVLLNFWRYNSKEKVGRMSDAYCESSAKGARNLVIDSSLVISLFISLLLIFMAAD